MKQALILGFTLFSMLFGAGNILFPPLLGYTVSKSYMLASLGFIVATVGMQLSTIILTLKDKGDYIKYYSIIGKRFTVFISLLTFVCLGPIIAIPRTAITVYELSILPFLNVNQVIFAIFYFILVILISINNKKVVDYLSYVFTPILVIFLFVFIILGVLKVHNFNLEYTPNAFTKSVLEGYQTLDIMGVPLLFSMIYASLSKYIKDAKELQKKVMYTIFCCIITLCLVYSGLIYIGAKFSNLDSAITSRSYYLYLLSRNIFGHFGNIALAIMIFCVCMTTSVGLVSVGADLIEKVAKIKYVYSVILISAFSVIMATMKLEALIKYTMPVLLVLYPTTIQMTFFGFFNFNKKILKLNIYGVMVYNIIMTVYQNSFNFTWIIVSIILFIIGKIIWRKDNE